MKTLFKTIGILAGLGILAIIAFTAMLPWMDRWGATKGEIAASLPGDELVPSPRLLYTRAVSIDAAPEDIHHTTSDLIFPIDNHH